MLLSIDTAPLACPGDEASARDRDRVRSDDVRAVTRSDALGRLFVSTSPAESRDRRLATIFVVVSVAVFVALSPFAKTPLTPLPAFIPIYQSALTVGDLLTAVLLFGQFTILRSRALLVLASAYLFTGFMTVAHTLSFPGLFAPGGWIGAGPQSTAWLYMLWHSGFPILIVAYVLSKRAAPMRQAAHRVVTGAVVLVAATVCALTLLATAGADLLPPIMSTNGYTPWQPIVTASVWILSAIALGVLWRERVHSVIDLWLMVVMVAWLFDIALSAVLNGGRFDLGFYFGRIYGLLAAMFVLVVLLIENGRLYARLVATNAETERSLERHAERLRILREMERAMLSEKPTDAIAAAVIQPLRKLLDVPRVNVNIIDYEAGDAEWLAAAGRRRTHVGPGVRFPLYMLGDLEALKRGTAQAVDAAALPGSPHRDALLASGVRYYLVMPMVARGELIGALSIGSERGSFPDFQTTIAEEVATQLAIAIMDARLTERIRRKAERLRIVHEIDRAIISEMKTESIASAVVQPLRELLGTTRVVVNLFDLVAGEVEWLAAAGRHHTRSGPGVRYSLRFMGDVAALSRGELQVIDTAQLPEGGDKQALLASGVHYYMAVPMIAGGELIGAVSFGGSSREFPSEQVAIVQEVAAQIAIAISQARLLERVKGHAAELESKVLDRTAELEAVNKELGSFSYSVSHDLRAPLRAVDGYARMLEEDHAARLDDEGRRLLGVIRASATRMGQLIDDLLAFSRLSRQPLTKQTVDSGALAREVIGEVRGDSKASIEVLELPMAQGDRALLKQVWLNLVGNALKYSGKREAPRVEIGGEFDGEENIYWVRDNGAGFDPRYAAKLFGVFQRLHSQDEFAGTGVGLAIVQRVISRHGGRVWAEGKPGAGACFFFSLPRAA